MSLCSKPIDAIQDHFLAYLSHLAPSDENDNMILLC